ncbi:MAG: acetylxylan esterase [Clostridia bacterium]|nr:acetylxylan esterase [Clostridia bacterium]
MSFQGFDTMTHGYTHTHNDQLKDFIYKRQEEYFQQGRARRDQISTPEELAEYVRQFRKDFLEGLGGDCFDGAPLNGAVVRVEEYPDYRQEAVIFQSRRDTYVTGTMYIPHGIPLPGPAVLFLCGHADEGRMDGDYQRVCATIARCGLIVFAVDPVGQGERASYCDVKTGVRSTVGCSADHDGAGVPSLLTGRTMGAYFYCDESRALDYLLTRGDLVDPARIGVTGNSGGGTQTAVMMMLDTRIAAAAPATFLTSREEYMYAGQAQDSEQIWPSFTNRGYEHVCALMAMAPRPVCVLATSYDFFPIEGTRASVEEGRRFYDMLGAGDRLRLVEDPFTHHYTPRLAEAAGEFFSEVLLGKKNTARYAEARVLPKEKMYATAKGNVRLSIPGARNVHDDSVLYAEQLRRARLALPRAERLERARKWLEERVYFHRLPTAFNARIFPRMHCRIEDGYLGTTFSWYSQKRLFNYGVLIRPEQYEFDRVRPTVLAVWDEGSRAIGRHEAWIRNMWEQGYQVFVLDVTGVGDVRQCPLRIDDTPDRYYKFYGTLYKLDCDLLFCGDSMAAMRVYDVLRCIGMLKSEIGLTEDLITLYAEGIHGMYATMAGFLKEDVRIQYGDSLIRSAEETYIKPWLLPYEDFYSHIIPGMLRYFDFSEIMREDGENR